MREKPIIFSGKEDKLKSETIILDTSGEAAHYRTNIEGWVDREGRFCGKNERMARYSGCTHLVCGTCGEAYPRHAYCRPCSERKEIERYNARPKKLWDGQAPLYSHACDMWFNEISEIEECCEEHECTIDDLRLSIGEPVHPRQIGDDYWDDDLPEDMTLNDCDSDLSKLVEAVNQYIRETKPIISWTAGKFAALLAQV
jgi:hypothetical protein